MNYAGEDYSMGHILRFARETGLHELTIDFVTGSGHRRRCYAIRSLGCRKVYQDVLERSGSDRLSCFSSSFELY
jgi:hypothetical protein